MTDHPHHPPSPLGSVMQSLMTGALDHGRLPRLPDVNSRPFWLGAALGAGLVLLLRSRSAAGAGQPVPPAAPAA